VSGGDRAEAEDRARRADDAVEPGAPDATDVLADIGVDVANQLALLALRDRIRLDEALGQPDHAELEAAPALHGRTGAAGDLHAAAADIDHHQDLAGRADAVGGGHVDEARFFGSRDDARTDAGLGGDGLQELAAVFRLPDGAGRDRDDLVDAVRFREALEFRQHLKRGLHRLRRQRLAVQAAGPESHHLLLAIDDLERQIGPHIDNDHVQGVGADVDGCQSHIG
jgi:hypothetical protein